MSYEYTDSSGTIRIQGGIGIGDETVRIEVEGAHIGAILVPNEDAPAVSLAILEAAGIDKAQDENYPSVQPERIAAHYLADAVTKRAEHVQKEAEDARVQGFRLQTIHAVTGEFNETPWWGMSERGRDEWRRQYRAAREFFEES